MHGRSLPVSHRGRVGPFFEQQADDCGTTVPGHKVEWCAALIVLGVRVGAVLDQQGGGFRAPVLRSEM